MQARWRFVSLPHASICAFVNFRSTLTDPRCWRRSHAVRQLPFLPRANRGAQGVVCRATGRRHPCIGGRSAAPTRGAASAAVPPCERVSKLERVEGGGATRRVVEDAPD